MIQGEALPTIDAPRLRLRGLTHADVDALFEVFSDPAMMRYWSTPPMVARSEAEAYLSHIQSGFVGKSLFQWGVERKDDARVLGTCTLFNLDRTNGRAEIGYGLGSRHWRRGYMTEALTALVEYAFGTLGLRRLEGDVDPRNLASIALLEKLGFRQEGLLRERWHVGGELQDSVFLGLLAREWMGRG